LVRYPQHRTLPRPTETCLIAAFLRPFCKQRAQAPQLPRPSFSPLVPREGERRRVPREDGRTVGRAPRDDDRAPDRIVRDERPMLPFPFFGGFFRESSRSGD
jgi:hypothetical protein